MAENYEEGYPVSCPKCKADYTVLKHGYYKCEECGTYFYYPEGFRLCPFCRSEIQSAALKCSHCGEWVNRNALNYQKRPTYLTLSFLFGNLGLGEFYAEHYATGFSYLILSGILAYCCPYACIALWIIAWIDAFLSDFGLPPEKAKMRKKIRVGFFAFIVVGLLAWGGIAFLLNA